MLHRAITKKLLAVFLAVNALALTGLSQDEEKTFTKDELDAVLVAGRFSREMQRTKDLRPLLAKYGVPNYGLWIARSAGSFSMEKEMTSPELSAKIDPILVRNFHVAVFNWAYLHGVWGMHQDGDEWFSSFPPKVKKILRSEPVLAQIFDDLEDEKVITSKAELLRVIRRLEQAAPIYRSYLSRFPKVKTKTYLSNLAEQTHDGELLYKAETSTCDDEKNCFGLPKRTTYFTVVIEPMISLVLVRSSGKMKIAYLLPYIGD